MIRKIILRACACLLILVSQNTYSWKLLNDHIDLSCNQESSKTLTCDYRLINDNTVANIEAWYKDNPLTLNSRSEYPAQGDSTAILFLIDTSDPNRQSVINKNINQIRQLLDKSRLHHKIGLASFDKGLQIYAPVGSSRSEINQQAGALNAVGLTTELYRNLLKSIELLSGVNAKRRVIYLFSDGLAEDKAYFHHDVINAARQVGVTINSLGFPRSISLSVALQTLRRLSEETGGIYVETSQNYNLPATFLSNPYKNMENGGQVEINLDSLQSESGEKSEIDLIFDINIGNIIAQVPVNLPHTSRVLTPPETKQISQGVNTINPQTLPEIQVVTKGTGRQSGLDLWLWYGIPIALLVLILLALITLYLLSGKQDKGKQAELIQEQFRPYAYLISQTENAKRYPITRTTWRIGRSMDNEMTLPDNSISRRHAEIQRYFTGKFVISDLDSSNGVYVNDMKINKHKLAEGDLIEIGDMFFRFTKNPIDYQVGEDTAMQQTKAPA